MLVSADVESSPSMTTSISADFAAAAAPALCALRSAFNGAIQTHQGGPTGGESSAMKTMPIIAKSVPVCRAACCAPVLSFGIR